MNLRNRWARLGVAFSTANLLLLPSWSELLFTDTMFRYYMYTPPAAVDYVAAIVNVFALGGLLYLSFHAINFLKNRFITEIATVAFFGLLLIPLNTIRLNAARAHLGIGTIIARSSEVVLLLMCLLLLAILCLVIYFRKGLLTVIAHLLIGFLPFAFITIGQAAYLATQRTDHSTISNRWSPSVPPSLQQNMRVVWLIFDELDQGMLFTHRPAGVQFPSFDRLKRESLFLTKAIPPSTSTRLSIPSMLTGTTILKADVQGLSDLTVQTPGHSRPVSIKQLPNIFRSVKKAGFPTTVVGWYHPYCRLFADSLDQCSWQPIYQTHIGQRTAEEKNLLNSMFDQICALSPFNGRRLAVQGFQEVLRDAQMAVTQNSGLIYVHFPVPHAPAIYDRETKKFTTTKFSHIQGYVDNLALVDDTLAEIRRAMEVAGTWKDSVLIVTSDHPWRQADDFSAHRKQSYVPFLIKMRGEGSGMIIEDPFETIHIQSLVLSIFQKDVYDYDTFLAWMRAQQPVTATNH